MMARKLLSVFLLMCILLTAILPVVHAEESEQTGAVPTDPVLAEPVAAGPEAAVNCHIMAQKWFGSKSATCSIGEDMGGGLSECLSNYFFIREESYKKGLAVRGTISKMEGCSTEVQQQSMVRATAIAYMQDRINIQITDA